MSDSLYGLNVTEKLKKLVSVHSENPPGYVNEIAGMLEEFGSRTNAMVEEQAVEDRKHNLLLTYRYGEGKKLILNTHMDVNSPKGQTWDFDPWEPYIKDNRLYGLGTCDAKGSLAAMLAAIELVNQCPDGVRGSLVLTAVMGEEAGGIGSRYLVENRKLDAAGAIVGEPTELLPCIAHKGTYMRRVTFYGKAVHSASSAQGINAVEHAAVFCGLYRQLQEDLLKHPHPVLGFANASVTLIEGGTRQNTIPERCMVVIDRRLLPGEDKYKAQSELEQIICRMRAIIPELGEVKIEELVSTIPSQTMPNEKIVKSAKRAVNALWDEKAAPTGFQAGCDMSKLVVSGGIPTVILGPGSLKQAHTPNEFVDLKQLKTAVAIYDKIIRDFLS